MSTLTGHAHSGPSKTGYAISSVDASPIFYEVFGAAQGSDEDSALPIVLCDGIGCDGFIWKYLAPLLASGRSVIHWHYRGHGRTPKPIMPERVAMADLADDLAAVLDDVGIESAVLAGHSMGVQVSLEFHRRHRYRNKGLVLVCGAPAEPLKTFKGSDFLEVALPTVRKTISAAPGLFSTIGRTILPRDWVYKIASKLEFEESLISQQDFMPYLRGLAHMDPRLFLAMLDEASKHSCRDILGEIRIPTLVIAGGLDTFTPAALSREMAEKIPGAELCVVEDGTHTAPLEYPDLVGSVTTDFLSRMPAAILR